MKLIGGVIRLIGMARGPRIHYPGAIYHVMARGVDGRAVFVDDRDRTSFLEAMHRIEAEASAEVIAYCLMGNHFHLAIKVESAPLAFIMQRLLSGYCSAFNHRHDRTGHLFQARYKAIICLNDRYLASLINYIHLNPVRSGFVVAPQDWPWSSYEADQVASAEESAEFDPWLRTGRVGDLARSLNIESVDLEKIGSSIAARADIDIGGLRSGRRNPLVIAARRLFVREAVRTGHPLIVAAKWLNVSPRSVSRYVRESNVLPAGLTPA